MLDRCIDAAEKQSVWGALSVGVGLLAFGGWVYTTDHHLIGALIAFGGLCSFAFGAIAFGYWVSKSEAHSAHARRKSALTDDPSKIPSRLRQLRSTDTNVHITYASNVQRAAAEELQGAFDLAEWITNPLGNLPLDAGIKHTYFVGVEVTGPNRFLVSGVGQVLKDAGWQGVRWTVTPTSIKRENPKWNFAQNQVSILIGNPEN